MVFFTSLAFSGAMGEEVRIYFFWGDGCPHCADLKPNLERFSEKYEDVTLKQYEVYNNHKNREFLREMVEAHQVRRAAVPLTFIGDKHWLGFRGQMLTSMEAMINYCREAGCPNPVAPVEGTTAEKADAPDPLTVPLVGDVNLTEHSLWFSTVLIGIVDGFNPCSLWVLSLLLALILRTKSRSRVFAVGITFLLITASAYGAFIAGVYTAMDFVDSLPLIQYVVGALAVLFGVVNVKDYFAYKKGLSFTISEKYQPKIYRNFRRLSNPRKSIFALILITAVMALGITLVELPCTAGFPVIWNGLISLQEVSTATYIFLLSIYVFFYLLIELLIFFTAVLTLDMSQLQQKHGELLKLFGGTIMVALAGVLFVDPHLMNSIAFTVWLFAGALGAALVLMAIRRLFLPERSTGANGDGKE